VTPRTSPRSAIAAALGLIGCGKTPALRVGEPVPAFSAVAHDGTRVSPEAYRGRWLVLWFYPKADTRG
jgi:peroxiredoxin Q/BCP